MRKADREKAEAVAASLCSRTHWGGIRIMRWSRPERNYTDVRTLVCRRQLREYAARHICRFVCSSERVIINCQWKIWLLIRCTLTVKNRPTERCLRWCDSSYCVCYGMSPKCCAEIIYIDRRLRFSRLWPKAEMKFFQIFLWITAFKNTNTIYWTYNESCLQSKNLYFSIQPYLL